MEKEEEVELGGMSSRGRWGNPARRMPVEDPCSRQHWSGLVRQPVSVVDRKRLGACLTSAQLELQLDLKGRVGSDDCREQQLLSVEKRSSASVAAPV